MKQLNKLEQLQQNTNGVIFIKSYPILNKLQITPTEKQIIELILSYQENSKVFKMTFKRISELLDIKYQTVKNIVQNLKKTGYLKVTTTKNYNGVNGGSSTSIKVDLDLIISHLTSKEDIVGQTEIQTDNTVEEIEEVKAVSPEESKNQCEEQISMIEIFRNYVVEPDGLNEDKFLEFESIQDYVRDRLDKTTVNSNEFIILKNIILKANKYSTDLIEYLNNYNFNENLLVV